MSAPFLLLQVLHYPIWIYKAGERFEIRYTAQDSVVASFRTIFAAVAYVEQEFLPFGVKFEPTIDDDTDRGENEYE